jgi:hypothetical protein
MIPVHSFIYISILILSSCIPLDLPSGLLEERKEQGVYHGSYSPEYKGNYE